MKIKTKFISDDNKEFDTEVQCREYELIDRIKKMMLSTHGTPPVEDIRAAAKVMAFMSSERRDMWGKVMLELDAHHNWVIKERLCNRGGPE